MSSQTAEAAAVEIEVTKKSALEQIGQYLPREWSSLSEDDIKITKISGGYMNTINLVERSTESINEPKQIILRHKGGGILLVDSKESADVLATELEEAITAVESSKAGTGPIVYGVFKGGRIEEFVKCHTLTHVEVLDSQISTNLAKCYARFHQISVPFKSTSFHKLTMLVKYGIKQLQENIQLLDMLIAGPFRDPPKAIDWDYLKKFNFQLEYEWILSVLNKIGYRMVTTAGK